LFCLNLFSCDAQINADYKRLSLCYFSLCLVSLISSIFSSCYTSPFLSGDYLAISCRDLSLATEVVTALHSTLSQDSESSHHLSSLSLLLSKACLNLHSTGRLHQYVPPTPTHPGYNRSATLDYDSIAPCPELRAFSSASYIVMRAEVLHSGIESSSCKKLFHISFEFCISPDNVFETPGEERTHVCNAMYSEMSANMLF
jgi:hypothetical protein